MGSSIERVVFSLEQQGSASMGSKGPRRRVERRTKFETLEDRQMFSAEPLGGGISHHAQATPDFWYDTNLERDLNALLGDIEQTLASAHALTGVTQARNDYGFIGTGQTVAVIDSGIAWDHPNLGNGFGANARVVGGWDFTYENDANPYDDGPAGSHGTHVAGIVGATANSAGDVGVAPGVDLVGLRVFDDEGDGYFSWVERALRWVHTNRNAFANPITAVNLSLGTAYNAATVPSWATLEDEFAQLEADGIFIAVSAGNSFSTYKTAGLSYPAASASVVPVMAVDDTGALSYFSQRHSRAIAAPGRSIRSTVPDYVGNQNGVTDDWANYSGTSMSSPYVAGASVLVREAMHFVGYVGITQDTIYDHMMATADQIFDSATQQFYKRLNVAAALDALIPDDEFGSTAGTAEDLGTIGSAGASVSGLIGKRDDVDFFHFTAAGTGTITFTVHTTHALDATWTGDGAVSGPDGNTYALNVVAGQSYTVGLSSSHGIGYFNLDVTAASAFTFTDWGTVVQSQWNGLANNGEAWYRVEAGQAGIVTAEAFFAVSGGEINLSWYDTSFQQVVSGAAVTNGNRVDLSASQGDVLYLRIVGFTSDVDIRLTNLVSQSGDVVDVNGTDGDDVFEFVAGSTHNLSVNGVSYHYDAGTVKQISFNNDIGSDTIKMTGTAADDTATLRVGNVQLVGAGYSVSAIGIEIVSVYGGGGNDLARFYDSVGDDRFVARAASNDAYMSGVGFYNYTQGFGRVIALATAGGNNRADFHDSAGDDRFFARAALKDAYMSGVGFYNYAQGFDCTIALATAGGNDRADFHDSAGDDRFFARAALKDAYMSGVGFYNYAQGFDCSIALATAGGHDRADFHDSAGDDRYVARAASKDAYMSGVGFYNYAQGFDRTIALATAGGHDRADFHDSAGDDRYVARAASNDAYMSGVGYYNYVQGFERTVALATAGGNDRADIFDSLADDVLHVGQDSMALRGSGLYYYVQAFKQFEAHGSQGDDHAIIDTALQSHKLFGRDNMAEVNRLTLVQRVNGYNRVTALVDALASIDVDRDTIDYVYEQLGI